MEAIFRREIHSYFKSPVAYCVVGFFAALCGLNFWNVNLANQSVKFSTTLMAMVTYLDFFIPILTMRLFADDKKLGTEVLLRTAPVRTLDVVLGKYFAAVAVFLLMCAETLVCPIIMSFCVNEDGVFPLEMTVGGYVAFIMLGLAYVAIGTLASSLADSQPVAALLGIVFILLITFIETIGEQIGGTIGTVLVWLSLSSRYNDFASGLFNVASIFYYLTFTVMILFVTTVNYERKRWN